MRQRRGLDGRPGGAEDQQRRLNRAGRIRELRAKQREGGCVSGADITPNRGISHRKPVGDRVRGARALAVGSAEMSHGGL